MSLDTFSESIVTFGGVSKKLFRRGAGPAVVVMHEIPGITPQVSRFAKLVSDEGFTVFLPVLFGKPGKRLSAGYAAGQFVRACISREFAVLARGRSSPVTDWLRALCRHAHAECGGPGVGAIGMCLTGNFALSLMVDESVMAPVLSQPSLPIPITNSRKGDIAVSDGELDTIKQRAENGCGVLGLRFTEDPLCPPERFETLRRELGKGFEGIEIDSSAGNPHGIGPRAHSVVTNDLVNRDGHPTLAALDRVLSLFRERLLLET